MAATCEADWVDNRGRSPGPEPPAKLVAGTVCLAARFEQEPQPSFGLVDKILKNAGGRHIAVLVAQLVALAHGRYDRLVVRHELTQHVARRHIALVVVFTSAVR